MLLDDLVRVIETLKERIAAHGASLRENETRTRMALIDPLLQALGWDVSDPAMVTPEYSVGASRADYGLLTSTGTPSALVEAKKLDESLTSHRMQMLNYANVSGIPHAGLTDGNRWEMYTVFDQAPIEQRRILDVSIANTLAHESALKLLLLWRPNLASGQPVASNAPIGVGDPTRQEPITPEPEQVVQPDLGSWISLTEVKAGKGQKPPAAIRFHSEESHDIGKWWQVLSEVTEKLVKDGRLTASDCPIAGLGFVNSSPVQPSGKAFSKPCECSGSIYLNLYMNSVNIVSTCKKLLSHCGVNPETVELRFG